MKLKKNQNAPVASPEEHVDELDTSLQRISETIGDKKKKDASGNAAPKKHNILPKVLSVLAALLLWLYVFQAVDIEKTFSDIPIRTTGFDTGLDLDIASNYLTSMSVTVRGTNSAVKELTADDIKVSVDMSDVNTVGHYSLPIHVEVPKNVSISQTGAQTLDIVVDKTVEKEIAVETALSYNIADPYELGTVTPDPLSVIIRGPESDIRAIERAVLVEDLGDLKSDVTAQIGVKLYDTNGYEISSPYIVTMPSHVSLKLPVNMRVKLPVDASVKYDADRFDMTFSPQNVYVFGPVKLVRELQSVATTVLNADAAGSYTLSLIAADGVKVYQSNVYDDANLIGDVTVTLTEKPIEIEEEATPENEM